MSKEKITVEKALAFRNNINDMEVYTIPTKSIDNGLIGKATEGFFTALLSAKGFTYTPVSSGGKQDIIIYRYNGNGKKKRVNVEVKTGRGEITETLKKSNYIIYGIRPQKTDNIADYISQFYLLKTTDFLTILVDLNLIQTKKATSGKIVQGIQNFMQIDKKTGQKVLSKKGRQFIELLEYYNISINDI